VLRRDPSGCVQTEAAGSAKLRFRRDMATLRMPDRLARELITYCISAAAPTRQSDALLRMLISAFGELPVQSAHIVADADGSRRHAHVVVDAEAAAALKALLPRALPLRRSPRGTSAFRVPASRLGSR